MREGTWRALSQRAHAPNAAAELKEQLAALTAKVEEADAKIRQAAKPKALKFEVVPAGVGEQLPAAHEPLLQDLDLRRLRRR